MPATLPDLSGFAMFPGVKARSRLDRSVGSLGNQSRERRGGAPRERRSSLSERQLAMSRRSSLSHCAVNPGPTPLAVAMTKAETMATMIADSMAPKSMGANRAGICIYILPWRALIRQAFS